MKKLLIPLISFVILIQAKSQINIDDQINRRVKSQFNEIRYQTKIVGGMTIKTANFQRVKKIEYVIRAGQASIIQNRIVYLPKELIVNYYSNKNCSDAKRGWTQQLNLKVTDGQSFKTTNKLTSSTTDNGGFTFKIPIPPVPGMEANFSRSVTFTDNKETGIEADSNFSKEETLSRTINLEVDSNKALFVKFQATKYTVRAPFFATVEADGTVTLENVRRIKAGDSQDDKVISEEIKPLRSLLSKRDRTFTISGVVENSKAGFEQVEFAEIALPPDTCDQYVIEPLISIIEKLSGNKTLTTKENNALNSNPFAAAIRARAKKVKFKKLAQ